MSQYSELIDKSVIKELKEIKERLQSQNQFERDTRDRVDISLSGYNAMRDRIEELEKEVFESNNENYRLKHILGKFGMSEDMLAKIVPENVVVSTHPSLANNVMEYRISFEVDIEELSEGEE